MPTQSAPPIIRNYTPLDKVRALTFYATPALYQQLADTTVRPTHFIYPGGHAYVVGYVNKGWYVVSKTLEADTQQYYMRRSGLQEVSPYSPAKFDSFKK
jgi:hypothetical protein